MGPTNRSRDVRGFTMLELLVAVSLMVMLLGVLTFVFRQSAAAVSGATETVTVVQKARNFAARMGREVGAAVETFQPGKTAGDPPILEFIVSDDGGKARSLSGQTVEFISQTLNEGILDTWCVRYYYAADEDSPPGAQQMGAIYRLVRTRDRFGEKFDAAKLERPEVVVHPVRNVLFTRVPPPPTNKKEIDTMPSSLRVDAVFLDAWGGTKFRLPQQFYFPVYQGH